MLPFPHAIPRYCVAPSLTRASSSSTGAALQRLSAFRMVERSRLQPFGYFNQYYPSPYDYPIHVGYPGYHPPFVGWSVNPVPGVSPQMYPMNTATRAPADPPTRIEAETTANAPTPSPNRAASSHQATVNVETEADGVSNSGCDDVVAKTDSRRPTRRAAIKARNNSLGIRRRVTFTTEQLAIMRHRFQINPYIKRLEAGKLAKELGVAAQSLVIWFSNERRRVRNASTHPQFCTCSRPAGIYYPPAIGLEAAPFKQ